MEYLLKFRNVVNKFNGNSRHLNSFFYHNCCCFTVSLDCNKLNYLVKLVEIRREIDSSFSYLIIPSSLFNVLVILEVENELLSVYILNFLTLKRNLTLNGHFSIPVSLKEAKFESKLFNEIFFISIFQAFVHDAIQSSTLESSSRLVKSRFDFIFSSKFFWN